MYILHIGIYVYYNVYVYTALPMMIMRAKRPSQVSCGRAELNVEQRLRRPLPSQQAICDKIRELRFEAPTVAVRAWDPLMWGFKWVGVLLWGSMIPVCSTFMMEIPFFVVPILGSQDP